MKWIINADDLGLTEGINRGIFESYERGLVRSATLMVNMPAAREAVALFKGKKDFGIGLHVTLDAGRPLLESHKSIVDCQGKFRVGRDFVNHLCYEEVENEIRAQLKRARDLGVELTHIDSHHHIHMWTQGLFEIFNRLAGEFELPLRMGREYEPKEFEDTYIHATNADHLRTTDMMDMSFYDSNVSLDHFKSLIKRHKDQAVVEVMVHPGYVSDDLNSSYREKREEELKVLTNPELMAFVKEQGIEITNYKCM